MFETSISGTSGQNEFGMNDLIARAVRGWLASHGIHAVQLVGMRGAGKTTLVESVLEKMPAGRGAAVIEANKLGRALDARLMASAIEHMAGSLAENAVLFIENEDESFAHPALLDLGEAERVVMLSLEDAVESPHAHANLLKAADAAVIGKIDLSGTFVPDDLRTSLLERCAQNLIDINPMLRVFPLSARSGEGLEAFGAFAWGAS